jgi:hypothetical protein
VVHVRNLVEPLGDTQNSNTSLEFQLDINI